MFILLLSSDSKLLLAAINKRRVEVPFLLVLPGPHSNQKFGFDFANCLGIQFQDMSDCAIIPW